MIAEFATAPGVVAAARRARDEGYVRIEAYSPEPVEGLSDAVGFARDRVAAVVLAGGLLGGLSGFFLQWYASVVSYPLNVGGRPLNSWPAFVPIAFELTVLGAALAAAAGMLVLNGLPRPHHPLFAVPGFERASSDRFFLCIESEDARFDRKETHRFLEGLGALRVREVPR
jgi:hypothetical protein